MKILVDEKIQSEERAVNYIDVGVHDNLELTDIKIDVSPKGNNFMAFTFTDPEGRLLSKTEWQPTGQEDDVLLKKVKNQVKRVKHIMTKFMAEELTKVEYDTEKWIEYAQAVKAKLDAVKAGVKVRVKAIYGNQNYVTLPNYTPFIERMDVATTGLKIQTIDKMTKDEPDNEYKVNNPLETGTSTTVAQPPKDNDLPF